MKAICPKVTNQAEIGVFKIVIIALIIIHRQSGIIFNTISMNTRFWTVFLISSRAFSPDSATPQNS